jgi:hypothetical protein
LISKNFNFSEIDCLNDKRKFKIIKRMKQEYVIFFHLGKLFLYPNENHFWDLFNISQYKDFKFEEGISHIFNISELQNIQLIGLFDLKTFKHHEFNPMSKDQFNTIFTNELKVQLKIYDPKSNGYIGIDEDFNYFQFQYPFDIFFPKIIPKNQDSDLNIENILEIIRIHSNLQEVLKAFQGTEIYDLVSSMINVFTKTSLEVNLQFQKVCEIEEAKEFSQQVSKSKFKNELMGMRYLKMESLEEFWETLQMSKLRNTFKKLLTNFKIKFIEK